MRLWTVHPSYLDARGLVALWREALLAQKVLLGKTKGYKAHPQLARFREAGDPVAVIASYLAAVHQEAAARGYLGKHASELNVPDAALITENVTLIFGQALTSASMTVAVTVAAPPEAMVDEETETRTVAGVPE